MTYKFRVEVGYRAGWWCGREGLGHSVVVAVRKLVGTTWEIRWSELGDDSFEIWVELSNTCRILM